MTQEEQEISSRALQFAKRIVHASLVNSLALKPIRRMNTRCQFLWQDLLALGKPRFQELL